MLFFYSNSRLECLHNVWMMMNIYGWSRHRDFWIFDEFDQKDQLYDMLNKQRMGS